MSKMFKGQTSAEANAKADAWIETQKGLMRIQRYTYLLRTALPKDFPKNEGHWTVSLYYDQES